MYSVGGVYSVGIVYSVGGVYSVGIVYSVGGTIAIQHQQQQPTSCPASTFISVDFPCRALPNMDTRLHNCPVGALSPCSCERAVSSARKKDGVIAGI